MKYKMIIIFNQEVKAKKDKYNFIIREKWIDGWGKRFCCGRERPKFYSITKNGKEILNTTLHQTFYARRNKIVKSV